MMRPKLRPTLSRKVKYLGIAPKAEKKLGREARRGSHDLRLLVGHANFLDVLVSELNVSDDENEPTSHIQNQTLTGPNKPTTNIVGGGHKELDGEELDDEDTASDSWSEYDDGSDDDDHALVRTVSGRPLSTDIGISKRRENNIASTKDSGVDYFQLDHPKSTVIAAGNVLALGEVEQHERDQKTDTIINVMVTAAALTPPTSPEEIVITHTSGK